jgi:enediyne biosynthesis protein E4
LETDSYFRNMGTYFIDATASLRVNAVTRRFTRFGVGLHDFNNDGWLDLYQANGRIARVPPFWIEDPYAEPNVLMRGTPAREFIEVHPLGGTATRLFAASRAAAFGDLDNDGGIDIVVVNRDGAPYLLRNIVQDRGHWLLCRIIDEHGRDALGATVYARTGGRIQSRLIAMNHGYFAAHDPRAHFGLGSERAVDDLVVRWPDGAVESFGSFDADQIVVVRRSHGTTKHSSEISRAVHWAPWASAP